jgi:hypothetical protein
LNNDGHTQLCLVFATWNDFSPVTLNYHRCDGVEIKLQALMLNMRIVLRRAAPYGYQQLASRINPPSILD